jgi:hypothetical protein
MSFWYSGVHDDILLAEQYLHAVYNLNNTNQLVPIDPELVPGIRIQVVNSVYDVPDVIDAAIERRAIIGLATIVVLNTCGRALASAIFGEETVEQSLEDQRNRVLKSKNRARVRDYEASKRKAGQDDRGSSSGRLQVSDQSEGVEQVYPEDIEIYYP